MAALSKPKVVALIYVALNTLGAVFAFALFPDYQLWAAATLPGLAVALWTVRQKQSRVLLVSSYLLLALGGLAVGHYYPGEAGAEGRLVMFTAALAVIGFTLARLAAVELGEA